MSTGLFGPRGPSYPYYPNRYSSPLSPYPNPYTSQTHCAYPNGYLSPINPQYPYPGQLQGSVNALDSYNWSNPRVVFPPKNIESILIAILILVVLDQVFIRPLKNAH